MTHRHIHKYNTCNTKPTGQFQHQGRFNVNAHTQVLKHAECHFTNTTLTQNTNEAYFQGAIMWSDWFVVGDKNHACVQYLLYIYIYLIFFYFLQITHYGVIHYRKQYAFFRFAFSGITNESFMFKNVPELQVRGTNITPGK